MIDKAFSIKHEGHLNKNNIIFKTDKYKKIVDNLIKYNNSLGKNKKDMDDMWVCDYCGSEEVEEQVWRNMNTKEVTIGNDYHQCVNCEEMCVPMTYFEWQEKIAEECGGNKDKYDEIMDGSRM